MLRLFLVRSCIYEVLKQVMYPILLRTSPYSRLWYKPDTMFSIPKGYVKIYFNCPFAGNSPEAEVLTEIFTRLLMDYLNEYGMLIWPLMLNIFVCAGKYCSSCLSCVLLTIFIKFNIRFQDVPKFLSSLKCTFHEFLCVSFE